MSKSNLAVTNTCSFNNYLLGPLTRFEFFISISTMLIVDLLYSKLNKN